MPLIITCFLSLIFFPDDVQPIIIFLTDGDATVGETNPSRILSYITEKNSGDKKAAIYSLAFGIYS